MLWIILALFVVGGFVYVYKYDDYHNIYNHCCPVKVGKSFFETVEK